MEPIGFKRQRADLGGSFFYFSALGCKSPVDFKTQLN
jgi:hypothetical protein